MTVLSDFLDISLILNNAKHGAMIASALAKVCQ